MENIIATTDIGFPVRLEGIVFAHAKFASYEPELFPGLIYRMIEPKVVLLIFVSGKVVITGARSEKSLAEAMEKIHPTLEEYRKTTLTPEQQAAADKIAADKRRAAGGGGEAAARITERGEGGEAGALRIADAAANGTAAAEK